MKLFSVACERFVRGKWVPDLNYLHAEDAGHARVQFCAANPNRAVCKIVGIGPVIGYNADDRGENVSV
jgi:hypothetical protein